MIRYIAYLAAICFVMIPVLAFTGDMDGASAFAALWPRLLVIAAVLGLAMLAIHFTAGRQPPPDLDEQFEQAGAPSISPALAGLYGGLALAALIVGYVLFRDHEWVRAIDPGTLILGVLAPALLVLAKFFDSGGEHPKLEPTEEDSRG